jgi:hypothetical protein
MDSREIFFQKTLDRKGPNRIYVVLNGFSHDGDKMTSYCSGERSDTMRDVGPGNRWSELSLSRFSLHRANSLACIFAVLYRCRRVGGSEST